MNEPGPSKAEQIEALIRSREYELTLKWAGRDQSGMPQYAKVFSVSRKEIKDYVRAHYRWTDLPFTHTSPGAMDGIYIIQIDGRYRVYYQERGGHYEEKIVRNEDEAWDFYVDYTLKLSGTGMRWELQ